MRITSANGPRTPAGTSALPSFRTQSGGGRELEGESWHNKSRARLGGSQGSLTGLLSAW